MSISSCEWIDGKIGKCIKIPKVTTNNITISELNGCKKFSFCCWLYLDTSYTNSSYTRIFSLGNVSDDNTGYIRIETIPTNGQFQIIYNKSSTHGSGAYATVTYYGITGGNTDAGSNKWVHITVTNDGTNVRTYFNGILKGTWKTNTIYDEGYLNGQLYLGGSYVNLNDVRVYDHCLSAKEVKEISKGLVCHYKLSGVGGKNIALNTDKNDSWGWSMQTGDYTKTYEDDDGGQWCVLTKGTEVAQSGWSVIYYDNINPSSSDYIENTNYIVSFDVITNYTYDCTLSCRLLQSNGTEPLTNITSMVIPPNTKMRAVFNLKSVSTLPASRYQVLYIAGHSSSNGSIIKFRNLKIEKGSKPTPWCPNPSDTIYSTLGFNDGIECDCSGYGNHGTKVGDIAWSGDSARYSGSYGFNNPSYIITPSDGKIVNILNSNTHTISAWINVNGLSSNYQTYFVCRTPSGSSEDCQVFLGINSSKILNSYYADDWEIPYSLEINKWHHIVFTSSNKVVTCYVNGVKIATTTKGALNISSAAIPTIGADSDRENYYFNGMISDVRIYSTCLSDEDIKSLYNVSASIDKTGVLFCGEVIENEYK